jgi:c(7)-type cytochrome triheme protein
MRVFSLYLLLAGVGAVAAAEPPAKIEFPSKRGVVVFNHAAHIKRENSVCATCHDKLWPQSTAKPLANSSGCHTCHAEGGKAFSARSRANCDRCHSAAPKDGAGK